MHVLMYRHIQIQGIHGSDASVVVVLFDMMDFYRLASLPGRRYCISFVSVCPCFLSFASWPVIDVQSAAHVSSLLALTSYHSVEDTHDKRPVGVCNAYYIQIDLYSAHST